MKVTIKDYCEDGLKLAISEMAVEKLAGNIVKEEHWRGQASAYRAMLIALPELDVRRPQKSRVVSKLSQCESCEDIINHNEEYKYCPYCGRQLRAF